MSGEASGRPSLSLRETGRFPKAARVLKRRDFDRIHRRGVRVQTPLFTVIGSRSLAKGAGARFGCAVSRKVGDAVVRNRLKRLMREVFRRCRADLPPVDLVVILRPSAARLASGGLEEMIRVLLPAFERAAEQAMRPRRPRPRPRGRGREVPSSPGRRGNR